MAHSVSARKRIRQNAQARSVNRWRKGNIRLAIKDYREAILHGTVEDAQTKLRGLYKMLDRASMTSTMHKNTAARYKSRLTAKLNQKQTGAAQG
jgi:small subunit ribosomal protein S20